MLINIEELNKIYHKDKEATGDVDYYIDEAEDGLKYFGISYNDSSKLFIHINEEEWDYKEYSNILMDYLDAVDAPEDELLLNNEYFKYLRRNGHYGDDSIYDYCGSFVGIIFDLIHEYMEEIK